mmetsp:Transcript_11461/g.32055  ORF Transcript_11461/g.32055 Transcript_11461/m.32055 type:complete len:240 (-) Transcript_11461:93-812(-)
MYKPKRVKMRDRRHDLRRVQPRELLLKHAGPVQLKKEVPTADEIQHQVQLLRRLKRVPQRDDVRMYDSRQGIALRTHVLPVILLQNPILLHHLHRKNLPRVLLPHLEHFPKRTLANHPKQLKVLRSKLPLPLLPGQLARLRLHMRPHRRLLHLFFILIFIFLGRITISGCRQNRKRRRDRRALLRSFQRNRQLLRLLHQRPVQRNRRRRRRRKGRRPRHERYSRRYRQRTVRRRRRYKP